MKLIDKKEQRKERGQQVSLEGQVLQYNKTYTIVTA